jgi:hypothetical protein
MFKDLIVGLVVHVLEFTEILDEPMVLGPFSALSAIEACGLAFLDFRSLDFISCSELAVTARETFGAGAVVDSVQELG